MTPTNAKVYAGEFGKALRVFTHLSTVETADEILVLFENDAGDRKSLTATAVQGDPDYAVEAILDEGFTDDMAGEWKGQVKVTFSDGVGYGGYFRFTVEAPIADPESGDP